MVTETQLIYTVNANGMGKTWNLFGYYSGNPCTGRQRRVQAPSSDSCVASCCQQRRWQRLRQWPLAAGSATRTAVATAGRRGGGLWGSRERTSCDATKGTTAGNTLCWIILLSDYAGPRAVSDLYYTDIRYRVVGLQSKENKQDLTGPVSVAIRLCYKSRN
jgi:hypothetical protein